MNGYRTVHSGAVTNMVDRWPHYVVASDPPCLSRTAPRPTFSSVGVADQPIAHAGAAYLALPRGVAGGDEAGGAGLWCLGRGRGPQGGFDGGPRQSRWQEDRHDVGGLVPGHELPADLVAGAVGGELVEDDLGLGRDGPVSRAWPLVRGQDRADLGGVALAGHGPAVQVAHGA